MQITNIHQNITREDFLKAINRNDFVEPKKGDGEYAASLQISEEGREILEKDLDIIQLDRRIAMPEYCGIYKVDKAIATAVEWLSKDEQIFVYGTIRRNFLRENTSGLTEEERQANIALGLKKAEYAAQNFIPKEHKLEFMDAMNTIAKLAYAGRADGNGNMNYGIGEATYLGHGSQLVEVTNDLAVMKQMDPKSYAEYLKISEESSEEDRSKNEMNYLLNWIKGKAKKNPKIYDQYAAKKAKYIKENVTNINIEVPSVFRNIDTSNKESFLDGLKNFMSGHQDFMSGILSQELSNRCWAYLS